MKSLDNLRFSLFLRCLFYVTSLRRIQCSSNSYYRDGIYRDRPSSFWGDMSPGTRTALGMFGGFMAARGLYNSMNGGMGMGGMGMGMGGMPMGGMQMGGMPMMGMGMGGYAGYGGYGGYGQQWPYGGYGG